MANIKVVTIATQGVPGTTSLIGGTTGQAIVKNSAADHDYSWSSVAGGASVWGGITGTLTDQTDLVSALNLKSDSTHNHDISYATVAQGTLADSALQSGANISVLTNDSGFITSAPVTSVAGKTDMTSCHVYRKNTSIYQILVQTHTHRLILTLRMLHCTSPKHQ